jgi:hypothetical protein
MTSKPLVPKVLNLHDNQLVFSNKDYQVVAIVYNKSHGRWCQDGTSYSDGIEFGEPQGWDWIENTNEISVPE